MKSLQEDIRASHWDQRIDTVKDAWLWKQAQTWLYEYIESVDLQILNRQYKEGVKSINRKITELASLLAWRHCCETLQDTHRQHMISWQGAMKKLGKGTGKNAPRYRREAQDHLNQCREAIPSWIMPLNRVWDTIAPEANMFDVIIIDEASQCGLEALPLLFLGKKILIVGDDKQISPYSVGIKQDEVQLLVSQHLKDFEFSSQFHLESSLFDHGNRMYPNRISLREHFRSMPEIIGFSNRWFYPNDPLIPLRQYGVTRLDPLNHVYVPNGLKRGSSPSVINENEADEIVDRITKMCDNKTYDGKTMGVISLQGLKQAQLIQDKLFEALGAETIEERKLLCGDPYTFQGDERDIIFLSLVTARDEGTLTLSTRALTTGEAERRFNVAASRARDMMVLFHSVDLIDLRNREDLRRKLLEYFLSPDQPSIAGIELSELEKQAKDAVRSKEKPPAPFDSWFEVDVALQLLRKNYNVVSQFKVASKSIDLVVQGGGAALAIECDGDHWHGPDQYEEDLERQRVLERCGWEFFRIRESEFYMDKEKALEKLWPMLEDRQIYPLHTVRPSGNESVPTQPLSTIDNKQQTPQVETDNAIKMDHSTKKSTVVNSSVSGLGGQPEFPDLQESEKKKPARTLNSILTKELHASILRILQECPNGTAKDDKVVCDVLRDLGIRTSGEPRRKFAARVKSAIKKLEKEGCVERYKTEKNQRVRFLKALD